MIEFRGVTHRLPDGTIAIDGFMGRDRGDRGRCFRFPQELVLGELPIALADVRRAEVAA